MGRLAVPPPRFRVELWIEWLLGPADYVDDADALEDSWRIALLASSARARSDRDRVRRQGVDRANRARDPSARPQPEIGTRHRVLFIGTIVLGMVSVAMVARSPRTGHRVLDLDQGALLGGILAVIADGLFWWLESRRASGYLVSTDVPARLHLVFAGLWIVVPVGALLQGLQGVGRSERGSVAVGFGLLVVAAVGQVVLWRRGRRSDLDRRRRGPRQVTQGLLDPTDEPEVRDALDRWWDGPGARLAARNPALLVRTHRAVLARLEELGLIRHRDALRSDGKGPPRHWTERRPVT